MRSSRSISAIVCSVSIRPPVSLTTLEVVRGVPLSMSKIRPEYLDATGSDCSVAIDALVREEPEEEEDDEEEDDDDDDREDDEGYSE